MKTLSIRQPWAWLIVNGYKDIENRNWATSFRGRIYVHTSKKFDYDGWNWISCHPTGRLDKIDINEWARQAIYPVLGAIIGEVDIVDCVSQSKSPWFTGRYGFILANPIAYPEPIPCKGRLGFFDYQKLSGEAKPR